MKAGRSAPYPAHAFNSRDAEAHARQDFTARRTTSHTRPAIKPRAMLTIPALATTAKKPTQQTHKPFSAGSEGQACSKRALLESPSHHLFFPPCRRKRERPVQPPRSVRGWGIALRLWDAASPLPSRFTSGSSSPLPPCLSPPPALGMPIIPVPGNRGGSRTGGTPTRPRPRPRPLPHRLRPPSPVLGADAQQVAAPVGPGGPGRVLGLLRPLDAVRSPPGEAGEGPAGRAHGGGRATAAPAPAAAAAAARPVSHRRHL